MHSREKAQKPEIGTRETKRCQREIFYTTCELSVVDWFYCSGDPNSQTHIVNYYNLLSTNVLFLMIDIKTYRTD